MGKIKGTTAREIKDSRGNPTVEVELKTAKGDFTASCPSGESTGKHEAVALPAEQAIKNVNTVIAKRLKGAEIASQRELDDTLIAIDGTDNKSKLGANATLPISIAFCRAQAAEKKIPLYQYIANFAGVELPQNLPLPSFNFIEGGAHADNDLDLQEFMVVPQKKSTVENLAIANKIFTALQELIKKNYGDVSMGDEGGFSPPISKTEQALFLLKSAIGNEDAKIIIDAAASQFFKNGRYVLEGKEYSREQLADFYKDLAGRFAIIAIEDPFAEDDWEGFKTISSNFKIQNPNICIIGDDLTTTNIKRIKEANSKNACNGIIIKPNQIGTVTETIDAAMLAKSYGWKLIVSHRAGETMDDFIADLAVGLGADFIKAGSPTQPERMVKYNRLLEIERELKHK